MNFRKPAVPAVAGDFRTLYVGVELSLKSWLVGLQIPGDGKQMSTHRVDAGDVAGLLKLISKAKARLGPDEAVRVVSCYEAGRDGFWLHRELSDQGIENRVLDAASIEVPRKARRAKTDRIDLRGLLRVLMALDRGESDCRVVRVPSDAQEDARRLGRERQALVRERGRHVNRIKSLCALHGIRDFEPMQSKPKERLATVQTARGQALPRHLREEIERLLDRLELVITQTRQVEAASAAQIAPVEPEVAAMMAKQAAPAGEAVEADRQLEKMRALVKLKSIGVTQATLLTREVFYRDFDNRRQVGAFFGLDGSPWRSGNMNREQGISKAGNALARWAAIEQGRLWLRYQPQSALSQWFRARTANQSKLVWRKMVVALARKLMIALWRYVCLGLVPEGATLKAA